MKSLFKLLFVTVLMMIAFVCFGAEAAAVVEKVSIVSVVFGCLLAISEVLGNIPFFKENSIAQVVISILKAIAGIFIKK